MRLTLLIVLIFGATALTAIPDDARTSGRDSLVGAVSDTVVQVATLPWCK